MNQERLITIIRKPLVTEKTARNTERSNQYAFQVASDATKPEIKAAVKEMFNVEVESVQVVNVKGKSKMFQRRPGKRSDVKKAYVTLAAGSSIDLMAQA